MLWEIQLLTDYAVHEERADSKWAATCQVRACGGNKAQVRVTNTTNSPWRLVDFDKKKCSCLRWQQTLRPCEHALAAYKRKVLGANMNTEMWYEFAWDHMFFTATFKKAVGHSALLAPDIEALMPDPDRRVRLPHLFKQAGRPKKKRMRTRGEG